jgi:hypothetical protein
MRMKIMLKNPKCPICGKDITLNNSIIHGFVVICLECNLLPEEEIRNNEKYRKIQNKNAPILIKEELKNV